MEGDGSNVGMVTNETLHLFVLGEEDKVLADLTTLGRDLGEAQKRKSSRRPQPGGQAAA